jgi:hypothetical protein
MSEIRQQALAEWALASLTRALGEPKVDQVGKRQTCYWAIPRYRRGKLSVYLMIDPADAPRPIRLLIGDPCRQGDLAQVSMALDSESQVEAALDDIRGRMVCE